MPKVSSDTKKYYRERVRSIIVQNPMLSGEAIKQQLEKQGLVLHRKYINSLVSQIHRERTRRADRATLNYALAAFEDSMTEVVKKAWEIANADYINPQARVMALREIREAHSAVFEKLFDAGVFERKLGTLDAVIRNTPLPEEEKNEIRTVFRNWGLLPAPQEDAKPDQPNNPA